VSVTPQGRYRYHRLATPQVARMLESLMLVAAATPATRPRTGPRDAQMRLARTCYDHIAGRLGVALADAMAGQGWVEIDEDAALVTPERLARLAGVGLTLETVVARPRQAMALCRPCLDWRERRPHLAGRLGAALCAHGLAHHWIRRREGSRVLEITPAGQRAFPEIFAVELAGA
jgi:hypothetical protein